MFRKNNFLGVWVRSRLGERSDRVKLPEELNCNASCSREGNPPMQSTEYGYRQGVYSRKN
ncbi:MULTISPECIES: hypothetical protein [Cyanophyceae]|uniref:hypothetical protein n=1 Tax=Cyanophyceae TaxID=3028117 RepID=UPI001681FA08|nr:hypothetical protein [Trichocoleus sp. FACHB-69]MBD1934752.1 hypothetical protein [Trichocoleus sp. FACHB-69]